MNCIRQIPLFAGLFFAATLAASCDSHAEKGHDNDRVVRIVAADAVTTTLGASKPAPIALGDAPVRVPLAPSAARGDVRQKLAAGGQVELVLSGLKSNVQPGITYGVYLGLAPGAAPDAAHFAGTINFFNNVALVGGVAKPDVPLHFDVTALASRVLAGTGDVAVTLVPDGKTENGAKPVVGRVSLIAK